MKNVIFFLSVILFFSCSKKEASTFTEMKSDELLSESFTDSELENLAKIVDFFESQICSDTNENIENCYNDFLRKDSINLVDDNFMKTIDYEKQTLLYSELDSVFFNDFFDVGIGRTFQENNTEIKYEYYHLKVVEKYGDFLKKLSKIDKFKNEYYIAVERSNELISPTTPVILTLFYKNWSKKDIKVRLIYSFHYLIFNEEYIKRVNKKTTK